ncbi:MAG: protein phosphatase 2C domain-containing protein [Gallionella sp.]
MKFSVHQASFIGNRKYNQDRVAYAYRKDALLLVLADGMGGHLHGELAATIAIETFVEQFSQHENIFDEPQYFLTETMRQAHKRIMTLPHDTDVGFPGTTCVAALLQNGKLYAAHAGDSRLYVMRDSAVLSRTRDHSMVQQWLDWGILTEEEARVHPRRNQITNCLGGIEDLFYAESAPVHELQPGDVLLLSSDGLWGPFGDDELAESFAALPLAKSLDNLMVRALERESGHSDNITGVAVLWGEGDQDHGSEQTVTHELEIN